MLEGSAWLLNAGPWSFTRVNGVSVLPDAQVSLPGPDGEFVAAGLDQFSALRENGRASTFVRVDPASLTAVSRTFEGTGKRLTIAADMSTGYLVDNASGLVRKIDPRNFLEAGEPVEAGTRVDAAQLTPDGTLWLAAGQMGDVAVIRDGRLDTRTRIAPPGHPLDLSLVGDRVVVTDTSTGVLTALSADGRVDGEPLAVGNGSALPVLPSTEGDGQRLAVATADGTVRIADLESRDVVTVSPGPRRAGRPTERPVLAGSYLYQADGPTGVVLVTRVGSGQRPVEVQVSGATPRLQVFRRENLVWANDPSSAGAAVFRDGEARRVQKYDSPEPAGPPTAAPAPPDDTEVSFGEVGGIPPGPAPAPTSPTVRPSPTDVLRPSEPPRQTTEPPDGDDGPQQPVPGTGTTPSPQPQRPDAELTLSAAFGPGVLEIDVNLADGGQPAGPYRLDVDPADGTTVIPASDTSFQVRVPDCAERTYTATSPRGRTVTAQLFGCEPAGPAADYWYVVHNGSVDFYWTEAVVGGPAESYEQYTRNSPNHEGSMIADGFDDTPESRFLNIEVPMGELIEQGLAPSNAAGQAPWQILTVRAWDLSSCASFCTYNHPDPVPLLDRPGGSPIGVALPAVAVNTVGVEVDLVCQTDGPSHIYPDAKLTRSIDPMDHALEGDPSTVWDLIRYQGAEGYVSDLYVTTPLSFDRVFSPEVPRC
ncbi:WD40 repeat domain-containing protein [Frankia nepalensis]|uniref:Uncharacterized protein n=1 Tax=Frankia nepalensis TaxID=1836974 RepID=A0A937UME7_9ACTN|nr:hypothetical protein [Frankia nepalensis]MBL7500887.1 hypothetical protein [Frankia nepalensis]MBL7509253.1 hypothetical protein [Frankia nepalensis]MBL7626983.1 hypothetical protein [Frankia nepalensis]